MSINQTTLTEDELYNFYSNLYSKTKSIDLLVQSFIAMDKNVEVIKLYNKIGIEDTYINIERQLKENKEFPSLTEEQQFYYKEYIYDLFVEIIPNFKIKQFMVNEELEKFIGNYSTSEIEGEICKDMFCRELQ